VRARVLVDGVVHRVVLLKVARAARQHMHVHVRHRLPRVRAVLRRGVQAPASAARGRALGAGTLAPCSSTCMTAQLARGHMYRCT